MDITFETTSHQWITVDEDDISCITLDGDESLGHYATVQMQDGRWFHLNLSAYKSLPHDIRSRKRG